MVCSVGTGTVAEYYLNEQAEYYTGGSEPGGRWYVPNGEFDLQNGDEVDAGVFQDLHAGRHPDGSVLKKNNRAFNQAKVGGYDLTFSAPKSVSVLWAVADEDARHQIEQAQEAASRAALDVLQEHAGYARRGKGGVALEKVQFFGATFQHGEARPTERPDGSVASDPQLHTHSAIFNLAQRADGTWGALDGRQFYRWKMTAGAVYRAQLAHELQTRLGVEIEVQENGLFEVSGIPKDVRDQFSSRHNAIETGLAKRGLQAKDAQALASAVAKASRNAKSSAKATSGSRHDRWRREAEALGLSEPEIDACFDQDRVSGNKASFEEKLRELSNQLTQHEAVFRREALYRVVAEAALSSGESMDQVEQSFDQLLLDGDLLEIGRDELGLPVFSTFEMIHIERELVETAARKCRSHRHRITEKGIDERLRSSDLTAEQKEAVRFSTRGADVVVLEGAAGAGKTYALKTVADAYRDEDYRVIGTATAWRMANQLRDDLGIETKATDAWLTQAKVGQDFLDANTILVVDEAGQLSSHQMLQIMKEAEHAKAKIILTGDQKQLQAVGAGPGLRLVAEQTGMVRIDTIVRQREKWARQAVTDLSLGRVEKAFAAYEQNNSIRWCSDGPTTIKQAVYDWKAFKDAETKKTAMVMAKSNTQVKDLNAEMRNHLRETGIIRGRDHIVKTIDSSTRSHDLRIAEGDQIIFKRRVDELGVINGTLGTVLRVEEDRSSLRFCLDIQGRTESFAASDIANEKGQVPLAHGYASTIYAAQGATVDAAFVVADHTLKRNEIYVAASRARELSNLYLNTESISGAVRSQLPLGAPERHTISNARRRDFLIASWERRQIKSSARDYMPAYPPNREKALKRVLAAEFGI